MEEKEIKIILKTSFDLVFVWITSLIFAKFTWIDYESYLLLFIIYYISYIKNKLCTK